MRSRGGLGGAREAWGRAGARAPRVSNGARRAGRRSAGGRTGAIKFNNKCAWGRTIWVAIASGASPSPTQMRGSGATGRPAAPAGMGAGMAWGAAPARTSRSPAARGAGRVQWGGLEEAACTSTLSRSGSPGTRQSSPRPHRDGGEGTTTCNTRICSVRRASGGPRQAARGGSFCRRPPLTRPDDPRGLRVCLAHDAHGARAPGGKHSHFCWRRLVSEEQVSARTSRSM